MVESLKRVYNKNGKFKKMVDKGSIVMFMVSALCMIATAGLVWVF